MLLIFRITMHAASRVAHGSVCLQFCHSLSLQDSSLPCIPGSHRVPCCPHLLFLRHHTAWSIRSSLILPECTQMFLWCIAILGSSISSYFFWKSPPCHFLLRGGFSWCHSCSARGGRPRCRLESTERTLFASPCDVFCRDHHNWHVSVIWWQCRSWSAPWLLPV